MGQPAEIANVPMDCSLTLITVNQSGDRHHAAALSGRVRIEFKFPT